MTSHELAKLLLSKPDAHVETHANNHTTGHPGDRLRVGMLQDGRVIIGNLSKRNIGSVRVAEVWDGKELDDEWR